MDGEILRWMTLGEAALERGQAQAAIDAFRRVLTIDPNEPRAHAMMALSLLRMKRVGAALLEARAALVAAPEDQLVHIVMGWVLIAHNKAKAAKQSFESARALDPASVEALRGLAAVERHGGRYAEAIRLLEKARDLSADDPDVFVDLGEVHLEAGRASEAATCAKIALQAAPEHGGALVLMGHALLRKGDVKGAREHAVWALQSDPTAAAPIELFCAIKARESFWLGFWFRWNAWMSTFGPRAMLILLIAYMLQRFLVLGLEDVGQQPLSELVRYAWLGFCVYTWVAPGMFRKMIEKELDAVQLRRDF